ncbi:hypothetical protein MAPG_03483 [Magnaporthiopsis poae ATCC 64411]|uniref:Uncharacterized protein n=1 Tax=Magnaporthiopsis poae (strain ATCC 64411 / 73-15) TaxID=644358 RepID=A0A0C4DU48_MAGP6|nr:hypothetical protein MAPG_03483 [Magnaporthiopsis poae ATCC 64411]
MGCKRRRLRQVRGRSGSAGWVLNHQNNGSAAASTCLTRRASKPWGNGQGIVAGYGLVFLPQSGGGREPGLAGVTSPAGGSAPSLHPPSSLPCPARPAGGSRVYREGQSTPDPDIPPFSRIAVKVQDPVLHHHLRPNQMHSRQRLCLPARQNAERAGGFGTDELESIADEEPRAIRRHVVLQREAANLEAVSITRSPVLSE